MAEYTFWEALERAWKKFAIYALSFMSAILLVRAIQSTVDVLNPNDKLWVYWVVAIVVLLFAMSLLALIFYIDPSDKTLNS